MDLHTWLERARIRPPEPRRGREAQFARNYRRFSWVLLLVMLPVEVMVVVSGVLLPGMLLLACTLGLVTILGRSYEFAGRERSVAVEAAADRRADVLLRDAETGLPNRNYLLDELTRDVARTVRYGEPLTLAVMRVEGLEDLRRAWGDDVVRRAGKHAAQSLRRIVRSSDFIARIDEDRFAALLVQCTEAQAVAFADRAALAVANRPLMPEGDQRLPVYITATVKATEFDPTRFRGPLEFLSRAGADLTVAAPGSVVSTTRPPARGDARSIRRQLIREVDPLAEPVIGRRTAS